jgi:hypothetical protein
MLILRKTLNTSTKRYFYFSNGIRITKTTYDHLTNLGIRNGLFISTRTFRHGQWYLEEAPLISSESRYRAA